MAENCLFCRVVRKEIPAQIVAETEDCVAFRDINPQAPVHILVVPRQHIPMVKDVKEPAVVGKLTQLAADLARREGVADSGYRLVINSGADAGQTVFHLHMHLLGGRHMGWPPG